MSCIIIQELEYFLLFSIHLFSNNCNNKLKRQTMYLGIPSQIFIKMFTIRIDIRIINQFFIQKMVYLYE